MELLQDRRSRLSQIARPQPLLLVIALIEAHKVGVFGPQITQARVPLLPRPQSHQSAEPRVIRLAFL